MYQFCFINYSCRNNHIDGHKLLRVIEPLKKHIGGEQNIHNDKKQKWQNIEVHPELEVEDMVKRLDYFVTGNNNDIKQ